MHKLKRRLRKKDKAIEYLGGCCWRCEEVFDRELYDFHHMNPSNKKYEWGTMKDYRWETIQKELERHSSDSSVWNSKYRGKEDLF